VVVYGYRGLHIHNPTTAALTLLLTVLVVSAFWGLSVSVFTAVIAALGFNYYFLPPVGTFAIADPENWVALFTFLITATIAMRLRGARMLSACTLSAKSFSPAITWWNG
jgi:two-component system sensor histidine kinase KdpD